MNKTSRNLMIALGLAIALAALIAMLQVVGAQSAAPASNVITISKETVPSGSTAEFFFGGDLGDFSLFDGGTVSIWGAPGDYTITETLPHLWWALTDVSCVGGDSSPAEDGVTVHLDAGEHITCTFTNILQTGNITVYKETIPSGSTTEFLFHGGIGGFPLSDGLWVGVYNLPVGDYTITETVPSLWELADASCVGGDSSPVENGVTVHLDAREHITCTFTNALARATDMAFFVHEATLENTYAYYTRMDHSLTNNDPDAIAFVTQNWNPGGVGDTYNDHSIGIWYDSVGAKWAIFNQDRESMPTSAAFNVLILNGDAGGFVHQATVTNTISNYTLIDHPLTNNSPNALAFVTQHWGPGGVGGTYNDHPIGMWYNNSAQKWAIFNQDLAAMPEGAAFNVLIPEIDERVFVHQATLTNTVLNYTLIDHPLTNDNPNAFVFVTQNWNPGGVGDTYNDHSIGVYYSHGTEKWAIFNQDIAAMPEGAAFNVLIRADKVCLPIVLR